MAKVKVKIAINILPVIDPATANPTPPKIKPADKLKNNPEIPLICAEFREKLSTMS